MPLPTPETPKALQDLLDTVLQTPPPLTKVAQDYTPPADLQYYQKAVAPQQQNPYQGLQNANPNATNQALTQAQQVASQWKTGAGKDNTVRVSVPVDMTPNTELSNAIDANNLVLQNFADMQNKIRKQNAEVDAFNQRALGRSLSSSIAQSMDNPQSVYGMGRTPSGTGIVYSLSDTPEPLFDARTTPQPQHYIGHQEASISSGQQYPPARQLPKVVAGALSWPHKSGQGNIAPKNTWGLGSNILGYATNVPQVINNTDIYEKAGQEILSSNLGTVRSKIPLVVDGKKVYGLSNAVQQKLKNEMAKYETNGKLDQNKVNKSISDQDEWMFLNSLGQDSKGNYYIKSYWKDNNNNPKYPLGVYDAGKGTITKSNMSDMIGRRLSQMAQDVVQNNYDVIKPYIRATDNDGSPLDKDVNRSELTAGLGTLFGETTRDKIGAFYNPNNVNSGYQEPGANKWK